MSIFKLVTDSNASQNFSYVVLLLNCLIVFDLTSITGTLAFAKDFISVDEYKVLAKRRFCTLGHVIFYSSLYVVHYVKKLNNQII